MPVCPSCGSADISLEDAKTGWRRSCGSCGARWLSGKGPPPGVPSARRGLSREELELLAEQVMQRLGSLSMRLGSIERRIVHASGGAYHSDAEARDCLRDVEEIDRLLMGALAGEVSR